MSDIMDRLLDTTDRDAVSDAREEIAALRAEVERLTGERDRQYDQNAEQIIRIAALEAENERLKGFEAANRLNAAQVKAQRAENERLRAALEGYVCTCTGGECAEQAGYRDECGKPARAALEEKLEERR